MPYNKYQPRQPSGVELEVDCKLHFTPINTDKEPTMCKVQCEALRGKQTMEMKETVSAFKYDSVRDTQIKSSVIQPGVTVQITYKCVL